MTWTVARRLSGFLRASRHRLNAFATAKKQFIHSFQFVRMKPDNSVIKDGVPEKGRAWVLVEPGRAYAIYLVGSSPAKLTLELPEGTFGAEWIDPVDGSIDGTEDVTRGCGPRQLQSPEFDQDIALRIKAE